MRTESWIILAAMLIGGCRDTTPPPPNVPVPTAENPDAVRTRDPIKPLPPQPMDVEQNR